MTPLLLLPGMLCDRAAWADQIAGLSDIAAPVVVDYDALDSIEAMARLALAAAPPAFAVAGHSLGGRVAQQIIAQAPDRVLKLALLGTDFRGHADASARANEAGRHAAREALAAQEGMAGFAQIWARQSVSPTRRSDTALLGAIIAMTERFSTAQLASYHRAGLNRPDFTDVLAHVRCPALVIAGADDALRPVATHREMAARIAGSELVVLDGCGHMLAMEQPQAVTAAMRRWLTAR